MKILVAVDLEHEPAILLRAASQWAQRHGATLDLAYASWLKWSAEQLFSEDPESFMTSAWHERRSWEEKTLAQWLERLPASVRGEAHLLDGRALDLVVAHSNHYDLVIIGTHGRTGLTALFLGSVAERVVRSAHCDVLVVPLANEPVWDLSRKPLRVLTPLTREDVVNPLVAVDRMGDVDLHGVFVLGGDLVATGADGAWVVRDGGEAGDRARAHLQARLEGRQATTHVLDRSYDNPGDDVAALAGDLVADLVVMPTHARKGIDRVLAGSVAERVVRLSRCPVLVLRAPGQG